MSAFSGPQQRGAAAARRAKKRRDAQARNGRTPYHRTRAWRELRSETLCGCGCCDELQPAKRERTPA